MTGLMRQSRSWWPHFAALSYGVFGYLAGLWLLLAEPVGLAGYAASGACPGAGAAFHAGTARQLRGRVLTVLTVLTVRCAAYTALGWVSLQALLLYALAYLLFLHVLRFMDVHQLPMC